MLALAALFADLPTFYQAAVPKPPAQGPMAVVHPVNALPAFLTEGLYRRYLRPGETVVVVSGRGNAGMLFQADAGFYFRIAGAYINWSLSRQDALPPPVGLLSDPAGVRVPEFRAYVKTARVGAIIVEQAWAEPWVKIFGQIGLHGTLVGGVTVYPTSPAS